MIPSQISFNTLPVNATYASETTVDTQKFSDILYSAGVPKGSGLSEQMSGINTSDYRQNIYETENLSDQKITAY
ncbi:hypothetical protein HHJ55_16880 [Escherichia coli]|nr:hypothetical protein HHJ55_16880 [Escherichia coli]